MEFYFFLFFYSSCDVTSCCTHKHTAISVRFFLVFDCDGWLAGWPAVGNELIDYALGWVDGWVVVGDENSEFKEILIKFNSDSNLILVKFKFNISSILIQFYRKVD